MAIDTSGKWWKGSSAGDVHDYLVALTADAYPIHEYRASQCTCGGVQFNLHAERRAGIARRTCVACNHSTGSATVPTTGKVACA